MSSRYSTRQLVGITVAAAVSLSASVTVGGVVSGTSAHATTAPAGKGSSRSPLLYGSISGSGSATQRSYKPGVAQRPVMAPVTPLKGSATRLNSSAVKNGVAGAAQKPYYSTPYLPTAADLQRLQTYTEQYGSPAANPRNLTSSTNEFVSPSQALTASQLQSLAHREIVLIVDKSSSMAHRDCPSNTTVDANAAKSAFEWINATMSSRPVSRWEWCCRQVTGLVTQLHGVSKDGLTVVLFDSDYSAQHFVKGSDIIQLFLNNKPGGRTNLNPALSSQLERRSRYLPGYGTKPLLVAILTDGKSKDADGLRRTIINATATLRMPDEVKLLFVNVGMEEKGCALLQELDDQLVSKGAKFDIVHRTNFSDIARDGLARKLAAVVETDRFAQYR